MPNLIETIKRIATEAVEASNPMQLTYGKIVVLSPLTVAVGDKLRLSGSMLIQTSTFAAQTKEVGDKLLLLRVQGGQQYLILDKAVGA